jgi:hypothetical protein
MRERSTSDTLINILFVLGVSFSHFLYERILLDGSFSRLHNFSRFLFAVIAIAKFCGAAVFATAFR